MNLGDLDLLSVQCELCRSHHDPVFHSLTTSADNLPKLTQTPSKHSVEALSENLHSGDDYASDISSATSVNTVVRSETPHSRAKLPMNGESEASIPPIVSRRDTNVITIPPAAKIGGRRLSGRQVQPPTMDQFDSDPPTPTEDDTPYLRYALEQITRDVDSTRGPQSRSSEELYPVERLVPDEGLGYVEHIPIESQRNASLADLTIKSCKVSCTHILKMWLMFSAAGSEVFIPMEPPIHTARYPMLTFVPTTLRPLLMFTLRFLCLLMTAAIMTLAIYSVYHDGVWDYTDAFDTRYFVVGFIPQILAGSIFLWVQGVMASIARILPYTLMASDNRRARSRALFLGLIPTSLLWPRFDYISAGQPVLGVCSILIFPVVLTIPLASCLFSVVNVNGVWRYATVTGVAWTLVAIYLLALLGFTGVAIFFSQRRTGLIWDPRSIADIAALLPRSNSLEDYQGTEVMMEERTLKRKLELRCDRLGYWKTTNPTQDMFYCVGEEGTPTQQYTLEKGKVEKQYDSTDENHYSDVEAGYSRRQSKIHDRLVKHRYIPWVLNDTFVLLWPIAFFVFYFAMLIVSFLPATALRFGFRPLLYPGADSTFFSPANFLYSFIPSLLGMLLYGGITTLFHTLARLTPWAALSHPFGENPGASILVDYTASASVPFSAIPMALANKHYLIAAFAFIEPITLLLPILAGGLFASYTAIPSGNLLMFTDLPAYYVMLIILGFLLVTLVAAAMAIITSERRYRLPKPVECLAEIVSFLYASEILHDAAFRAVRSKSDLQTRLVGMKLRNGGELRFYFGTFKGRDGKEHLGVERFGRGEVSVLRVRGGVGEGSGDTVRLTNSRREERRRRREELHDGR
jgi:hypothetical protein